MMHSLYLMQEFDAPLTQRLVHFSVPYCAKEKSKQKAIDLKLLVKRSI